MARVEAFSYDQTFVFRRIGVSVLGISVAVFSLATDFLGSHSQMIQSAGPLVMWVGIVTSAGLALSSFRTIGNEAIVHEWGYTFHGTVGRSTVRWIEVSSIELQADDSLIVGFAGSFPRHRRIDLRWLQNHQGFIAAMTEAWAAASRR